jgi:hypothetical protein
MCKVVSARFLPGLVVGGCAREHTFASTCSSAREDSGHLSIASSRQRALLAARQVSHLTHYWNFGCFGLAGG